MNKRVGNRACLCLLPGDPPVLILYCPEMPGSFLNRPYPAGVGFTYPKVLEFAASIPQIQSSPQILLSPRLGLTDRLGVQLSLDNIKGGSADSQTWSFTVRVSPKFKVHSLVPTTLEPGLPYRFDKTPDSDISPN